MTLAGLIKQIGNLDEGLTIYAEKCPDFTPKSKAVLCYENNEDEKLSYFLEIDLAKEAILVWSEWRNGKTPTLADKCEAVIYYAQNDAYLPVEN